MKTTPNILKHYLVFFSLLLALSLNLSHVMAQGESYCTNCTRTYTSTTGTVTVNAPDTVCLNAPGFIGNVVINGGALKICSTASPSSIAFNNGNNLAFIINNNSLTLKNYSDNRNVVLTNNSVLNFTNSVTIQGTFINKQFAQASGDINVNSTGRLTNSGFLTVTGNLTNNFNVNNSGTIEVHGGVINNGSGNFVNTGSLFVDKDLLSNGILTNGGTIRVTGTTQINGGSRLLLENNSTLTTTNLGLDGIVHGTTTGCEGIRISNRTVINSSATVSGRVFICDANGVEVRNGTIIPPAVIGCACPATGGRLGLTDDSQEGKEIIAYPSPFTTNFTVEYTLQEDAEVSLTLFTTTGEKLKEIIQNESQGAGEHKVELNAAELPAGIYMYVLQTGKDYKTGRVVKK